MAAIHRDELGWFKQDNIEMDYITVGASGAQQLAGGSLNIAHSGYPDFARASLRGRAGEDHHQRYRGLALRACSPSRTIKHDRRSQGQADEHRRRQRHHVHLHQAVSGLRRPEDDATSTPSMPRPRATASLRWSSGGVDATILNPPTYFKATSLGYSNLGDMKPSRRGHSVHGVGRQHALGGEEPRGDERVRAQLQARRAAGSTIRPTGSRRSTSW